MIYLQHPFHGIKVAYTDAEIADDKKNGWSEVRPEPVAPDHLVAEVLDIEPPGKACPACGKTFQRGLTMHMKYCKGIQ